MAIQALAERPPLIEFEYMAEEDRDASIKAGFMQYRNVPYAVIRQAGSRDTVTKPVDEMLKKMDKDAHEGRCPREWVNHYEAAYKAWKEGNEIPVFGTPVLTSLLFSPAEQKALIGAGIRTIEDAAAMNEAAMAQVGMGARELKDKANQALSAATIVSKENEALKGQVAELKAELAKMQEAIVKLTEKKAK